MTQGIPYTKADEDKIKTELAESRRKTKTEHSSLYQHLQSLAAATEVALVNVAKEHDMHSVDQAEIVYWTTEGRVTVTLTRTTFNVEVVH